MSDKTGNIRNIFVQSHINFGIWNLWKKLSCNLPKWSWFKVSQRYKQNWILLYQRLNLGSLMPWERKREARRIWRCGPGKEWAVELCLLFLLHWSRVQHCPLARSHTTLFPQQKNPLQPAHREFIQATVILNNL